VKPFDLGGCSDHVNIRITAGLWLWLIEAEVIPLDTGFLGWGRFISVTLNVFYPALAVTVLWDQQHWQRYVL